LLKPANLSIIWTTALRAVCYIIGEHGLKFKSIFILFCVTLLVFLAILILLPLIMLDSSISGSFWQINWPLILVLVILLCGFTVFYIINRRLFFLLEKEDWPALVRYLEDRVVQRGRYSFRLVRLLANCYLVLSDSASVMSLENKVAIARPSLVEANVLVFGTARILGKDISGAVRFFEIRINTVKASFKEWVRWYHGFALLLDRRFEEAGDEFSFLAKSSKDGVITGLSSYFLTETIALVLPGKRQEFRDVSAEGKERVRKSLPDRKNWDRETSRLSTEIHAAAISKYIEEAGRWLYTV